MLARTLAIACIVACHQPPAAPSAGEQLAETTRHVLVGRRAPAATLALLDGRHVALGDLAGKQPVYLKFWATWCTPCQAQMPHLEAAYRRHGDRIATYAIALGLNDPIETVRAFVAERGLRVPVAFDADGSLGEAFQVAVTPLHILIDRAGVVRYVGHEASAELDAALEALVDDPGGSTAAVPAAETSAATPLVLRDGSTFSATGSPAVLTFVATWCDDYLAKRRPEMAAACAAHAREVARLQRAMPQLTWVIIAHPDWTDAGDLDEYVQRFATRPAIGLDHAGAWFARFHVRDVATTIVLDATGVERGRITGRGDDLSRAVADLAR